VAIFKSEKELNDYFAGMVADIRDKYGIDQKGVVKIIDMSRTLMAEYSRLLAQGKIKRPYTYSADRPKDHIVNVLQDETGGIS
jgi:hypothetical protein